MPWEALAAGGLSAAAAAGLRWSSVVLLLTGQATAAAAMLQLDGLVERMVLCPPDLASDHLPTVAARAGAEVILCDRAVPFEAPPGVEILTVPAWEEAPSVHRTDTNERTRATEWVLLTSGTSGVPKLVVHTFRSLTAAINLPAQPVASSPDPESSGAFPVVWSTFYDIRRYGGLQIFLRAALAGCSLVLGVGSEALSAFLGRIAAAGVTHLSGTPSHWRRALMHPEAAALRPSYVRLSGEIADAGLLQQLSLHYPQARVAHAFASTEAGLVFEVNDGAPGVPAAALKSRSFAEIRLEEGTLRVRSEGTAACYLGPDSPRLRDREGWVDTGDVLEERGGRLYFAGRRDGTINVGGQKVHPEEVEAVIQGHPEVRMALVSRRSNPILGAVVTAEVVLKQLPGERAEPGAAGSGAEASAEVWKREILALCRAELPRHKVPVMVQFVPALAVGASGKLVRRHA